jgi:transporter family protein
VDKLSIIMVAIFGVLFLGEKLSAINWAGVVLIAGGVILLTLKI